MPNPTWKSPLAHRYIKWALIGIHLGNCLYHNKLLPGFMAPSALSSLATSPDITYEFDIFLSYHQKELALIRTFVEILKKRDVRTRYT